MVCPEILILIPFAALGGAGLLIATARGIAHLIALQHHRLERDRVEIQAFGRPLTRRERKMMRIQRMYVEEIEEGEELPRYSETLDRVGAADEVVRGQSQ